MDTSNMLKALEALSKKGIKPAEGDYIGDDGLLYCGQCHTRKQTRVKMPNGATVEPMCLCECAAARQKAEKELERKQDEMYRIQTYKREGFLDSALRSCTFDRDDDANSVASRACRNYVDNFKQFKTAGKGLLLYGNVGTGKTFLASCIANALMDELHPCLVTNFARIINKLSGIFEGKNEYIDSLNRYHLLVIDDLATERNTEYVNEIVFNVIDSRYRSGKPLIVTTNISPADMDAEPNISRKRIYSRIKEMCVPIEVTGTDRRSTMSNGDLWNLLYK